MMEITNDLIAVQVMGWTRQTPFAGSGFAFAYCGQRFRPLNNSDHDIVVFDYVRNEIDERNPKYGRFYEHLSDVLSENPDAGPMEDNEPVDSLYLMHWYRVGDYSRAAVAAIQRHSK